MNNQNNPFGMNRQNVNQNPQGIMQVQAPAAPQVSQEPGVGAMVGNMLIGRGLNKGVDLAMEKGGAFASNAIGNLGTAAELGTTIGSEQTAMLAAQNAGMAEGAAGAATGAGKGAAGAGAAGAGGASTGLMAAAAPMAAPLLIGGLLASKLF